MGAGRPLGGAIGFMVFIFGMENLDANARSFSTLCPDHFIANLFALSTGPKLPPDFLAGIGDEEGFDDGGVCDDGDRFTDDRRGGPILLLLFGVFLLGGGIFDAIVLFGIGEDFAGILAPPGGPLPRPALRFEIGGGVDLLGAFEFEDNAEDSD